MQTVLLYPWMNEGSQRLSRVYTRPDVQYESSRQILKDYTELFVNIGCQGGCNKRIRYGGFRILVEGDPGIGKTTFTHKVALDWSHGELHFEIVFIVKLRDMLPDQTIPQAIVARIKTGEDGTHESRINGYLAQSNCLLILDGLDEIDLKKYPQVVRVLNREDFPTCGVLATTRPHISPKVKSSMTCIAKILGFSEKSAKEYVFHIIPNEEDRYQFFKLLKDRKMEGMYKIPIILKALALLFKDNNKLPDTYTTTYDNLIDYLKKTCEGLSAEQIEEAMNLVNELAFKGLTQKDQQLIFLRDEINNENVYKLRILSATQTVTYFRRTSTVQFAHKTVQEHSAADHVARNLIAGIRDQWKVIKEMFRELFAATEDYDDEVRRQRNPQLERSENDALVVSGTFKFVTALMTSPRGRETAIQELGTFMLNNGFYKKNPDILKLKEKTKSLEETNNLTAEEFDAFFHYGIHLLSMADTEQKEKMQQRTRNLIYSNTDAKNLALILSLMTIWMKNDPEGAIEVLTSTIQSLLSSAAMISSKSVTQQVQWLQDQANSMKVLFRFIIGKLKSNPEMADQILGEIAEMLVEHAFHPKSGEVMSIHFIKQYILDLMSEAGISPQNINRAVHSSDLYKNHSSRDPISMPVIVHIKTTTSWEHISASVSHRTTALKLENITNVPSSTITVIENMKYLALVELQDISEDLKDCEKLAKALAASGRIVSLFLHGIKNVDLCTSVLQNLPPSAKRLTLTNNAKGCYGFPQEVKLEYLHIAESVSGVSKMFYSTTFPNLKRLSIMNSDPWSETDIGSLREAVMGDRMPQLQHLCIKYGRLANYGKQILDIMRVPTVRTVDLTDTSLRKRDGKCFLRALENGELRNIESLSLYHNPRMNSLVSQVKSKSPIDIQCSKTPPTNTSSWSLAFDLALQSICSGNHPLCTIL